MPNPLYDALFAPHVSNQSPFLILSRDNSWTYSEFLNRAERYSRAIEALGLNPGDRLAVQLRKSPQALAVYAACVKRGVIFLPLNTAYTPAELSYFLSDSAAALFLCDADQAERLAKVAQEAGTRLETLGKDGSLDRLAHSLTGSSETLSRAPDDLAALLYTSGTTGRSKGAMLTQDNLLSNARALTDLWRFTAEDVLIHALPIFHTHGLFVATNVCLLAGCAMRFHPAFDAQRILADMPRSTALMGVPTFYTRLLEQDGLTRECARNMRLFVSGSAPLLPETHEAFERRTGHRILERYGMTETNMTTSNPYKGERRAGTVGLPLPGVELRLRAEDGALVEGDEIGILEVRGPNVFKGYWNMPEKTAQELLPDGFFITGDLARISADGYVTIVGRAKDMIISGGLNVYPREIEELLDAFPDVKESAVVGVPHPDFGETPIALIVAEAGTQPDVAAMQAQLENTLARFKHPRRIIPVAELPRNTMGKVQKARIRDEYRSLFTPG